MVQGWATRDEADWRVLKANVEARILEKNRGKVKWYEERITRKEDGTWQSRKSYTIVSHLEEQSLQNDWYYNLQEAKTAAESERETIWAGAGLWMLKLTPMSRESLYRRYICTCRHFNTNHDSEDIQLLIVINYSMNSTVFLKDKCNHDTIFFEILRNYRCVLESYPFMTKLNILCVYLHNNSVLLPRYTTQGNFRKKRKNT